MKKRSNKLTTFTGLTIGLALVLAPFSAIAQPDASIEGVLVKESVHELPAPDVALASDGRALIVWQDDLEAFQITNVSGDGSVATFTTSTPHPFENGDSVSISGINPSAYNNYENVTVTGPTTFTADSSATDAYISGGRATLCGPGGTACSIVASIVEADGTTLGAPFKVSEDVDSEWYFAAPSVTWNEDLKEWLVLMTSNVSGSRGVYAQRVSSSGSLVGTFTTLPTYSATTIGDRETVETLPSNRGRVKASATWSSVDQMYLVTWWGSGDATALGGDENDNIFGYFLNGDLTSGDGVNAAFLMSSSLEADNRLVKHAYSAEIDKWALVWTSSSDLLYQRSISITSGEISADDEITVVNAGESGENYIDWHLTGDVIWVDQLDAWLTSWNVEAEDESWDVWGRTVSPNGDLGSLVQLSEFGLSSDEQFIQWMSSHDLEYDPTEQVIYGAVNAQLSEGNYVAHGWSFNVATMLPIGWVEYFDPSTSVVEGETVRSTDSESSRPQISAESGGLAVVYQNWPEDWGLPSEVRYQLLQPAGVTPVATPTLADTGINLNWLAYAAFASIVIGMMIQFGLRRRVA